ncbi:hypothetical protein ACE1TH_01365 [Shouchella sp. JSM 1781072]|uniref:hypothetical protein n=1 Tax=Shouchella sp. JSM 1781072 TaxID=3344581 RepID=UPI000C06A46A
MVRFNKWIDALILAMISGSVYFVLSLIYDDHVKWINALAIAVALFLTHTLLIPRIFNKRKSN